MTLAEQICKITQANAQMLNAMWNPEVGCFNILPEAPALLDFLHTQIQDLVLVHQCLLKNA